MCTPLYRLHYYPSQFSTHLQDFTKTKKGKQHTGVLWIYLELNKHRTTSDSPYLDIASMTTLKTFERYFIEVRIETQYIDVIFRQVMEIC